MDNRKFEKPTAGLLLIASPRFRDLGEGLSRGTYGERKSCDVETILGALRTRLEVVFPEIVYSREDVQRAMDLFYAEKVDFIVAEFLSWSEDFAWIRFLRDMPEVPVVFANPVKERMSFDNTLDEDDFIDFLCSGTLVGSLEASGSIQRLGRKNITILTGSRRELTGQIMTFAAAAKVRSVLRRSTLGLLANYNPLMWSTYVDPYNLFARVGPEMKFLTYSALAEEIDAVSGADTKEYLAELTASYRVAEDVDPNLLFASARASLGLARSIEANGVDAMIFNDLDPTMFKLVGLRPGFYHPSINRNLSVLVPEADTGAGLITYILKLLSGKQVNFIEPFHVEAADNTFAGGHAGPNDHNDPAFAGNVIIARDVRFAKTGYRYAGAPFAWTRIPPGRKTMAHLSENNGRYKIIATLVDSLEGEHRLASYSHGIFRPGGQVRDFFDRILKIGATQHFALVDGDYLNELSILAGLLDFDFHAID